MVQGVNEESCDLAGYDVSVHTDVMTRGKFSANPETDAPLWGW